MDAKESNVVSLDIPHNAATPCEFNTVFLNLAQIHLFPALDDTVTGLIHYLDEQSACAENNSKIMRLMEVRSALQKQKGLILEQYQVNLIAHFDHWPKSDVVKEEDLLETELSLLENREVEQRLAWQAAARHLELDSSYQQFTNCESRISSLMVVNTESNPIGPMSLCESFAEPLSSLEMAPDINCDLLMQFASQMKPAVAELWKEADAYLESIGLELTASQPHINNSDPSRTVPEEGSAETSATAIETGADEDFMEAIAQKVVNRVENLLTSQQASIREGESGNSIPVQVAAQDLAVALTSIQQELISQQVSIFTMSESIHSALEDRGMKQKMLPRHLDLINVIGMLFEFILEDHQLPNDIKKLIGLLQIPVLKQALLDKEFLVNRHHPARELLNTMISAGMHLTEAIAENDPVKQLIEKTVKTILKGFSDNPDIFSDALEQFTKAMILIDEHDLEKEFASLSHEESLEEPQEEAREELQEESLNTQEVRDSVVDYAINSFTSSYVIPQVLSELVTEAWPRVLQHMIWQGKDDDEHWYNALNVLDMLLWNLQLDNPSFSSAEDWQQLKKNLQAQLSEIQYDPLQVANWIYTLDNLMLAPLSEEALEEEEIVIQEQPVPAAVQKSIQYSEQLELEETDANPEAPEVDLSGVIGNDNLTDSAPAIDPSSRVHTRKLRAGQWVEFIGKDNHRLRCKLATIVRESDRYIFVNRSGMKVVEWSGSELERGISRGNIQVLENTQFFDRALHAVMENFLKF